AVTDVQSNVDARIALCYSARAKLRADFIANHSCARGKCHRASAEVSDHNHVARLRAAREGELLAVAREVEPEDLVGLEVGQLYRLPAVQRQRPDVGDAVDRVYVGQGASIRRPAQTGDDVEAVRDVEHLDGVAAREGDDGDLGRRVRLILSVRAGDQAAVWRGRLNPCVLIGPR